jgi:hypothetical protein
MDEREQSWRRPAAAGRRLLVFVQSEHQIEGLAGFRSHGKSRHRRSSLRALSRADAGVGRVLVVA